MYQDLPAGPSRFVRNGSGMSGAKRASHSRTASGVKTKPRSRNRSAGSRKRNVSRSRHKPTKRTTSGGYCRKWNGVPVRSWKLYGRKTDVKESEWLADLLRHGLLKASFIPPKPIRDLRELVRYRKALIKERTQEANRL